MRNAADTLRVILTKGSGHFCSGSPEASEEGRPEGNISLALLPTLTGAQHASRTLKKHLWQRHVHSGSSQVLETRAGHREHPLHPPGSDVRALAGPGSSES